MLYPFNITMKKEIYFYKDYKQYLRDVEKSLPGHGHGFRSQIARAISCHVSYISQILNKGANISMEQAEEINKFLGHTDEEANFFLLLVQYERAGSANLKLRIRAEINNHLDRRLVFKDRVDIKKSLSENDQLTYYSAWHYAAVHILVSIPGYNTREAIAEYFHFPLKKSAEILEFLESCGLIVFRNGTYQLGEARIFLGNDSKMISKHHSNWRVKSIDALDKDHDNNLHLSTVVSLSEDDVRVVKEILVKASEAARKVIKNSREETIHCLNIDFFNVR
jgi:uncharacterized protein (TIGR02147 family)